MKVFGFNCFTLILNCLIFYFKNVLGTKLHNLIKCGKNFQILRLSKAVSLARPYWAPTRQCSTFHIGKCVHFGPRSLLYNVKASTLFPAFHSNDLRAFFSLNLRSKKSNSQKFLEFQNFVRKSPNILGFLFFFLHRVALERRPKWRSVATRYRRRGQKVLASRVGAYPESRGDCWSGAYHKLVITLRQISSYSVF